MAVDYALVESLVPIGDDTNYDSIMIGNSCFTDDEWDLRPFIIKKTTKDSHKYIRFDFIHNEDMKFTVKQYAYHKLGTIKPKSLRDYINGCLPNFIEYCSLNDIKSFADITQRDFLEFNLWLKETKKTSASAGYICSYVVEDLIKTGQIKGWNVPQNNIFRGVTSSQLWIKKSDFKKNKTKPIPEDIFNKILYHAVNDEKDILTKSGIIIQSQTGLRISEVLSIKEGCVKRNVDGNEYMEVELSKTEKGEPIVHKVFIDEFVSQTIAELSEHTEELRRESGLKELFLCKHCSKHNAIGVYKDDKWSTYKLSSFVKRWNIRDNKGNLYPLKSHQFRATFVRELVKRKVPIAMIMKQYSHVSIEMTAHYLTLQSEEVKNIYADMVLSPDSKIAGLRAKEIKDKLNILFNGKTEEQISDVIEDLALTMSFNPLPTGVCLYDFRRGNCTDGDGCFFYNCPNYITEVKFYPILKSELDLMEQEMERLKLLGREREWQKQFIKHKYLKPLVESLEVQKDET